MIRAAIVTISALILLGCSPGEHSREIRTWSILYDQDPSPEHARARTGWKPITVPAMFTAPYERAPKVFYVWMKGEIDLDDPTPYTGLSLGKIYFNDVVYVNGTVVGRRSTTQFQNLHCPRNYGIPRGLLHRGRNEVLVYLGLYGVEYGGLSDRVYLRTPDRFLTQSILSNFLFQQLTVGILVLFVGQIVFCVIMIIADPKDPTNVIMLLIFVVWVSYLMAIYSPYYPLGIDFRISFLWACSCIAPIFFFLFIQSYFRVHIPWLSRAYVATLLLFSTLILVNQNTVSEWFLGRVLGMAMMAVAIPGNLYFLYYISRVKPSRILIFFIVLGVLPAMTIVGDILNYLFIQHVPPLYHIYTLPLIVVLFMILKIRDMVKKEVQLEIAYKKLRDMIETQPGTTDKEKSVPSLTPAMEKKLQQVLEFLRENFKSDISREGLARTMDLSPDHMSRMFKTYTGQRINDYINFLRIEEAARSIKGTDAKIIDIAFDVGFESLVTFNRAFLKVKNMTPSEYRSAGELEEKIMKNEDM